MAGVPVVGNIATGAIVGLTSEGAELCDRMLGSDVAKQDIPASCGPLVSYLDSAGFIDKGAQEHSAYTSAYLHVTNRCNLACTGCYSANAARNVASDPTLKDLFHALDALAQLGVNRLVISGGEPFARDDLADVLGAAREAGFSRITVITNGVLCTPDRVGSLSGLVDLIAVSFDGASAQARAWLRGSQLFDVLAEAVHTCKDASIPVQVLPTLHAHNIDDVPAYIELADSMGATLGFSLLSGDPDVLGELMPSEHDVRHLAEVMAAAVRQSPSISGHDSTGPSSQLAARISCGASRCGCSVAADGTLYPCHMLMMSPFALGNVFTDSFDDVRRALDSFRLPCVEDLASCSSCDVCYLCGGGCRARAFMASGALDGPDPYCGYYRRALEIAIDEFLSGVGGGGGEHAV